MAIIGSSTFVFLAAGEIELLHVFLLFWLFPLVGLGAFSYLRFFSEIFPLGNSFSQVGLGVLVDVEVEFTSSSSSSISALAGLNVKVILPLGVLLSISLEALVDGDMGVSS